MATTIMCNRCKRVFDGDRHDESAAFDGHDCVVDGRRLADLPLDLLSMVALGRMSESEAWAMRDKLFGETERG